MTVKVYIDGKIVDRQDAMVSVFDRGFLFGDSVYETMRTQAGNPVDLQAHLDRLKRSADAISMPLPEPRILERAIDETLAASGNDESSIRVVVTRGSGEIGLATDLAESSTLIIMVRPLVRPPEEFYQRGAKLAVVGVQRTPKRAVDPAIKSGNYLNNIMALSEARKEGAHEAVMCDRDGRVAEGSTSNIFAVIDGVVTTPPLHVGLLPGITRSRVLELAQAAGLEVREAMLTPDQLSAADEVFITSSIRGVLPIGEVGEVRVPAPGPITRQIMKLYRSHLDSHGQS
ncbi:MAG: aminotransferase class IV [Deltaproteobacteria bacterium]|nr:aminotransferase class IV [Deltaproteobacteria bacterium]